MENANWKVTRSRMRLDGAYRKRDGKLHNVKLCLDRYTSLGTELTVSWIYFLLDLEDKKVAFIKKLRLAKENNPGC